MRGSAGGSVVRVEVQDSGSGIPAKDLPHIFERFYRGDTSRTRATGNQGSPPGSGLGLAIAQSIVEAHGGSIEAQSQVGEGACFVVMLPSVAGVRDQGPGVRDQAERQILTPGP